MSRASPSGPRARHPWARGAVTLGAAALIALGIGLRFYRLDHQLFWLDEAYTSLHVAGYPGIHDLIEGGEFRAAALQERTRIGAERGFRDTVASVGGFDPLNPPLYFVLLRAWAGAFGDSVFTLRAFSAVASVASFPLLGWLAWELFRSGRVVLLSLVLMAWSPLLVTLAQETRSYALSTVTALLASALLLRAVRTDGRWPWVAYAVSVTAALYVHPLFGAVMMAHGGYVLGSELGSRATRWRWPSVWTRYALATVAGVIGFVPWLWVLRTAGPRGMAWAAVPLHPWVYWKRVGTALSWIFMDLGSDFGHSIPLRWTYRLGVVLVIALWGYALVVVAREAPWRPALFVVLLTSVPVLMMVLPDLVFESRLATTHQYLLLGLLGALLATSYLFASRLESASASTRWRWAALLGAVLAVEVWSCVLYARSDVWWTKLMEREMHMREFPAVARSVNGSPDPLLVVDRSTTPRGDLLVIGRYLRPDVRLVVVRPETGRFRHDHAGETFLFNPSRVLQGRIEQDGHALQPVVEEGGLWRVHRR
jgi:uncharacterized membrane protein